MIIYRLAQLKQLLRPGFTLKHSFFDVLFDQLGIKIILIDRRVSILARDVY